MTRYLDLTFHFISVYNTCMKIFFIASSVYILYLMRVKYKASYDPGLDTFRFEYLLGVAMLLGVAFSYNFTPVEVKLSLDLIERWINHMWYTDIMVIFHLARIGGHYAPVVYVTTNGWSRNHYDTLLVCIGSIPCIVPGQLGVSLRDGRAHGLDCLGRRSYPNSIIQWLFLLVLYKVCVVTIECVEIYWHGNDH